MSEPTGIPFAIAVPVGPGDREVERVQDLAASLGAYEHGPGWFVMVDDAVEPRGLDRLLPLPAGITPVSLHHLRHDRATEFRMGKGIVSAVLVALKWIQANTPARFALKLDTDSLIINPFADQLGALFDASPKLGIIGAYRRTPNGTPRKWMHVRTLNAMRRPAFSFRHPLRRFRWRPPENAAHVAPLIDAALRHGYDIGEHCMGGGYAVSRAMLYRMAAADHLTDPARWMGVDLPEDVTLGLHARALGMTMLDQVDRGQVFGVRYEGLAFVPEELVARGFSVIHAVKNDPNLSEAGIRRFFAERRAGLQATAGGGGAP